MAWRYQWLDLRSRIFNVASKAHNLIYELEHSDKKFAEDCFVLECLYEGCVKEENKYLKLGVENYREKLTKKQKDKKPSSSVFTPVYIADYICRSALEPLVKKKSFEEISQLKICDPCCGGGIFNVVAHDYIATALEKKNKGHRHTCDEIGRIAVKTIFGVDIEPKAVEMTKLVLNLNILRWGLKPKFKEFANGVEQSLFSQNLKCDKLRQNGPPTAQGHARKKRSTRKTTAKRGKKKSV